MIDFIPKYTYQIYTSLKDENYGSHIGENSFYAYFLLTKNEWINKFVSTNNLNNTNFITRSFKVNINKEVFHPSTIIVSLKELTYEKLSVELYFDMHIGDKKVSSAHFELVPVDTSTRKVISKSFLYEKVQTN